MFVNVSVYKLLAFLSMWLDKLHERSNKISY